MGSLGHHLNEAELQDIINQVKPDGDLLEGGETTAKLYLSLFA